MPARRHTAAVVTATLGLACVLASVLAVVQLPGRRFPPRPVSLRDLSATDVVALPARREQPRSLRVVVLGDSVATGAGCGCRPFGPRLAVRLADRLHRAVVVSTLAKDGAATADLASQVRDDQATTSSLRQASVVTVTIGANDFDASLADSGCSSGARQAACFDDVLSALPGRLGQALHAIRQQVRPDAQVLVTGYWNVFLDGAVGAGRGPSYERTSRALTSQVNAELRTAAAGAGATYVDLYGAFHAGGSSDDTPLLASDGDHPSAAGQMRIAELLAGYVSAR